MKKLSLMTTIAVALVIALVLTFMPVGVSITSVGMVPIPNSIVLASPGWISPTGFVDGSGTWTDETLAYDEDTGAYAYTSISDVAWSNYLELTISVIDSDKVQVWSDRTGNKVDQIEVDVYYSSSWNNIYSGTLVVGSFQEYAMGSTQSVTAMRVRYHHNQRGKAKDAQLVEADFNEVVAAPNITNLPINQDFGVVGVSSTSETGLTYFTVTNNSGAPITITIKATDFTGGNGWTLSDTATPGVDTVGLKAGLEGGDYTIIVRKTETFNILVSGLADGTTQRWGLKLYTATEHSDGVQKSTTVTLTATLD